MFLFVDSNGAAETRIPLKNKVDSTENKWDSNGAAETRIPLKINIIYPRNPVIKRECATQKNIGGLYPFL